jgi:hypothetical protein
MNYAMRCDPKERFPESSADLREGQQPYAVCEAVAVKRLVPLI